MSCARCLAVVLLAGCMPGGGFEERLAEQQRDGERTGALAHRCAGELRSLAALHPADADRALTTSSTVQSSLRGSGQAWRELAANEQELEGSLATLRHATADGAVALERVVSAVARVHRFQAMVCEARDVAFTLAKMARPGATSVVAERRKRADGE